MERFVKNKDLILRRYESVKADGEFIKAKLKDGKEQVFFVEPFIDDIGKSLEKIKSYELCGLVVYNTKENFDVLVDNWDKIVGFKRHFSMYFVNPFSKTEKSWTIYPATHSLIVDKSGLKASLKTLFSKVDETAKEELSKLLAK